MSKLTLGLSIIGLSYIATSCHKKDPEPLTRTQLLVDKKWQVSSYVVTTPTGGTQDLQPLVLACTRDDYQVFSTPNTYTYDEGPTKCSVNGAQTQLGLWALSVQDSQLTITFGGHTRIYSIKSISSDKLNLTTSETQSSGVTVTYDIVFDSIK